MPLAVTSQSFEITENSSDGSFDLVASMKRDPVTYVMVYLFYDKGTETRLTFKASRRDSNLSDEWVSDPKRDGDGLVVPDSFYLNASADLAIPFNKAKNENGFKLNVLPTGSASGTLVAEIVTYTETTIVRP